jgi:flagellar biosynthesis protein FlhF
MGTTQPQIRVKSYFATSVPDAIELARKELGPDALLLSSRRAPPEARHLGPIEVVFGDNSEVRTPEPEPAAPPVQAPGIDELRQKMEEIRSLLIRAGMPTPQAEGRRRHVEEALLEAGVTRDVAAAIDDAVVTRLQKRSVRDISRPRPSSDAIVQEAIEEMNQRLQVRPGIGKATALVGPPGAGKTTTLVKLAITEGLMKGRPVRLISADTQRIAASEQLRIYAAILGVPFQSVESISALAQAIDSAPANAVLLIDTPGLSPALFEGPGIDLATFLRQRQDIDTHLVLTAPTRSSDLESAVRRFSIFRPAALIFTRLDETDSFGAIFSEAVRTKTPVSYICDGQLVPENIAPASTERLTESLVRHLPQLVRSAA